jgi:hypothetical protein
MTDEQRKRVQAAVDKLTESAWEAGWKFGSHASEKGQAFHKSWQQEDEAALMGLLEELIP